MSDAWVSATDVSVAFGGLRALSDVSMEIRSGTITGLIGPNGAGKTTFYNVVTGMISPTAGTLALHDGDTELDFTKRSVQRRCRLGLARTFQRLETFRSLTALENVQVAFESRRRWDRSVPRDSRELATELLETVGAGAVAAQPAGRLPTGSARLVELARALATNPRFLLLDEPSSGLNDDETARFGELLTSLADDGLGILLVEHDMGMVMEICESLYVLDRGQLIGAGAPATVRELPEVQAAYLGSSHE